MGFKFELLDVWKRSIDFADEMFTLAQTLPKEYQFSLGKQPRRASLSVPANIVKGSMYEVVSLMVIIGKRGCLNLEKYRLHYQEANEIASILSALTK